MKVAKTFAEDIADNDYTDEFKAELASRYDEYVNGGKLISEATVKKAY